MTLLRVWTLVALSRVLVFTGGEAAWYQESLPQQLFDFDCPPGEALNGLSIDRASIAQSPDGSRGFPGVQTQGGSTGGSAPISVPNLAAAPSGGRGESDYLFRIFCNTFYDWSIGAPRPPLTPPRSVNEFFISQGSDLQDPLKNCAPTEYMCGLASSFLNTQRTYVWITIVQSLLTQSAYASFSLKFKCCKSPTHSRDVCQTVGPVRVSLWNPTEIMNPASTRKTQKGCPPHSAIAFAFVGDSAQMLACEFREAGKQYPPTCSDHDEGWRKSSGLSQATSNAGQSSMEPSGGSAMAEQGLNVPSSTRGGSRGTTRHFMTTQRPQSKQQLATPGYKQNPNNKKGNKNKGNKQRGGQRGNASPGGNGDGQGGIQGQQRGGGGQGPFGGGSQAGGPGPFGGLQGGGGGDGPRVIVVPLVNLPTLRPPLGPTALPMTMTSSIPGMMPGLIPSNPGSATVMVPIGSGSAPGALPSALRTRTGSIPGSALAPKTALVPNPSKLGGLPIGRR